MELYSGSSPVQAIHMKQVCSGKRDKKDLRSILIMLHVTRAFQSCHAALNIFLTNDMLMLLQIC